MHTIGLHVSKLSGFAPAVPTPFGDDGKIDVVAFEHFCQRQIEMKATALVVCGTTGEAPTLSPSEHSLLIRRAKDIARRRVPVIAGAGSNATAHAIELTREAEAAGADAIPSVVPYYNKPAQRGLQAHFTAIAQATALPVFLYDVPSRTAIGLADETVARLAEVPNIIGLKDAAGDATRPLRLRPLLGQNFRLLSGDDGTALAYLAQGGNGCISVVSNVAPGLCRNMFLACRQGQIAAAQRWGGPLSQLTAALFRESNPAPLKYALSLLGLMTRRLRLPLVEVSDSAKADIEAVLARLCGEYGDYTIGAMAGPGLKTAAE